MHLIIPGSLPPPSVAAELLPHIEQHCPALVQRMKQSHAQESVHVPEETGCTPFEYLELTSHGFNSLGDQHPGAAIGPYRAGITTPGEPIWIADFCSIAVGREGPLMARPEFLQLDAAHADALFDAVKPLWADSEISALPIDTGRWRVWLPPEAKLQSITPSAVCAYSVSDWWPQNESFKPWRKLLNEIQMVWHHHPVNAERAALGLEPINSLWLYGGGQGWKPTSLADPVSSYHALHKYFLESDWAKWIEQLPALSRLLDQTDPQARLTLTGERRIITLNRPAPRWWSAFLPQRKPHWKTWWTRQN